LGYLSWVDWVYGQRLPEISGGRFSFLPDSKLNFHGQTSLSSVNSAERAGLRADEGIGPYNLAP